MSNCPADNQLDAFYDGELDAAQTAAVRDHLARCGTCSGHLAEYAAMSRLFAGAKESRLLPISSLRLHNAIDAAMESGLVRMAWMLSAVAACILIVGSFWLVRSPGTRSPEPIASTTPPWATVATTADADLLQQDEVTPVARWYLASAGPRSEDLP